MWFRAYKTLQTWAIAHRVLVRLNIQLNLIYSWVSAIVRRTAYDPHARYDFNWCELNPLLELATYRNTRISLCPRLEASDGSRIVGIVLYRITSITKHNLFPELDSHQESLSTPLLKIFFISMMMS